MFINLIIMFITMGAAAHSPPLYSASASSAGYSINPKLVKPVNGVYPPVQHSGGIPDPGNFGGSVNGMMQAVYSYGGCMIFPEFMAEIKRPRDFLKGMWGAQLFIYICYMLYGLFMYGYQGQYVQTPAYLGISQYGLSTAGNSLAIVSALIAATLYGNIGIKGTPYIPKTYPKVNLLTLHQSYTTTSSWNSSAPHPSPSKRANTSGSPSSHSTGPSRTSSAPQSPTSPASPASSPQPASCNSPTRSRRCYTWASTRCATPHPPRQASTLPLEQSLSRTVGSVGISAVSLGDGGILMCSIWFMGLVRWRCVDWVVGLLLRI